MKVRLLLNVGAYERFVVARYFRLPGDPPRPLATWQQVRRFTQAALRSAVREQAEMLEGRARATAQRLGDPREDAELLIEPREKQRSLAW